MSILLIALSLAAAPEVELRTLAGQSVVGTLKELSGERVAIERQGQEQVLATKDLLAVAMRAPAVQEAAKPQAWIDLVDGARLACLEYAARQGQATLKLVDGQEVSLATDSIAAVRLKEQSENIAQQWAEIVSAKRSADVIVIRREEAIDYLEGVLGDVTPESVQFTLDGDLVNVKRPRVEGFLYFHPQGAEFPAPMCEAITHDGARLPAASIELRGAELAIVTPSGVEVVRPLESIKELDFSLGKVRYLSDLEWESIERQDFLASAQFKADRFYEPRKDYSFLGPLRLGNKNYAKGLALKSYTKLVYRLPGKYSRLTGLAGINGYLAPGGHVRLVISGDQQTRPLLEAVIAGTDAPQPLSIDLTGVRRLTIKVDFGDGGDSGDHLNLCDVRIIQ
jgi:hypothetical protein